MTMFKTLSSLSMDLHRIAMARKRGSDKVASRFNTEAQKRIAEVDITKASAELADALTKCSALLQKEDNNNDSSQILFFSEYFQNEALKLRQ